MAPWSTVFEITDLVDSPCKFLGCKHEIYAVRVGGVHGNRLEMMIYGSSEPNQVSQLLYLCYTQPQPTALGLVSLK